MCDTMVVIGEDGILFAKNSDRDVNESQVVQWVSGGKHRRGERVRATWIDIPQAKQTYDVVISRPWWTWGAEMGSNEHGVTIGNEAVFTRQSTKGEPGLLGMDLLRLALERSRTAEDAVQIIIVLLQRYGQVGSYSHDNPSFTYHNSFLVADRNKAYVVETAGQHWAVEKIAGGARSISNGLTIESFAHHSDPVRSAVSNCRARQRLTQRRANSATTPGDLMSILRDNGTGTTGTAANQPAGPTWSWLNGSMTGPNMHGGGFLASSQTVASWVSDLRGDPRHWVTATADPALSLFKPIRVDEGIDLGPEPTNQFDPATLWWRHEQFHRAALRDWETAVARIAGQREQIEREWLADPPPTSLAFAQAEAVTRRWQEKLVHDGLVDTRPRWVQRRWRAYDRAAGMPGKVRV